MNWRINEEWAVKVYERFEFQEGESEEFEITVSKEMFNCLIVDFSYNHRDKEDSFFFVFRLKAFPKASFELSQTYNRPKPQPGKI